MTTTLTTPARPSRHIDALLALQIDDDVPRQHSASVRAGSDVPVLMPKRATDEGLI
jgi:hypothetical protein